MLRRYNFFPTLPTLRAKDQRKSPYASEMFALKLANLTKIILKTLFLYFRPTSCVNSYFRTSTASDLSAKKRQRCSQYSQQFKNQWRDSCCTRTKTIGWKVRNVIFLVNKTIHYFQHLVQNLLYLQNRLYQPQGTSTNIFSCLSFSQCLFWLHFTLAWKWWN